MKKLNSLLAVALMSLSSIALATNQLTVVNPATLHWYPANDLRGAEVAIISGNPDKKEPFIARVKLPSHFEVPIHTHHINEYDTVISGAIYIGTGTEFNPKNLQKIPAGSFVMIPAHVPHYLLTKQETVLQVNGMGPWGMVYQR